MAYPREAALSLYKPKKVRIYESSSPNYSWVRFDVDIESCYRRLEDVEALCMILLSS